MVTRRSKDSLRLDDKVRQRAVSSRFDIVTNCEAWRKLNAQQFCHDSDDAVYFACLSGRCHPLWIMHPGRTVGQGAIKGTKRRPESTSVSFPRSRFVHVCDAVQEVPPQLGSKCRFLLRRVTRVYHRTLADVKKSLRWVALGAIDTRQRISETVSVVVDPRAQPTN